MTLANIEIVEKEEVGGIIYIATNKVNGKVYIGLTTRGLDYRMKQHLRDAEQGIYESIYFHRSLRKHGEGNFIWDTVDSGDSVAELCEKEVYWISHYNSYGTDGYNMTKGGEGVSGLKRSDDFRKEKSELLSDMWENGHAKTMQRGSSHHGTTLTEDIVLDIKNLFLDRVPKEEIASKYKTTISVINSIKIGITWRHVITDEDVKAMSLIREGLNSNEAIEIKDMIIEGDKTLNEIAKIFEVDKSTISAIKMGLTWKSVVSEEDLRKMEEVRPTVLKRILTQEEVLEIKDLLIEGDLTQKEIAEIYQIATSSPISAMKRGVTYSDIITEDDRLKMKKTKKKISKPAPIRKTQPKIKKVKPEREKMKPKIKKVVVPKVKKTKPKSPKVLKPKKIETEITKRTNDLSENEILEIKRLLLENQHSQNRIAQMFGVHAMIISRIKNGQIHSNIN